MNFKTKISKGFWADRIATIKTETIYNIYRQFLDTGRFEALKCVKKAEKTHIFWDSDVAKWIEAVAYILQESPDKKLEALSDDAIADICNNQREDGYFNSYFQTYEPENVFKFRAKHELYNAGHLIEAAIAYKRATGKTAFFEAMKKYADYIYEVFFVEKSADFLTPGHEEIEIALLKLYEETTEQKYLALAEYFITERGKCEENDFFAEYSPEYNQSHASIYSQKTAEGHAVRAMYYYVAVARLARIKKDKNLTDVCLNLFDDIIRRKVYITGGIGSSHYGEAFASPYDLPNDTAYTETCASIGLFWFCKEIYELSGNVTALELADRILYNNILASISLDGKAFFYSNPLSANVKRSDYARKIKSDWLPEIRRAEIFSCSCCPPNVARFFANLHTELCRERNGEIYIEHLISFDLNAEFGKVTLLSDLPFSGKVQLVNESDKKIRLRIPDWSKTYYLNDTPCINDGKFISLGRGVYEFKLELVPRMVYANTNVACDNGKCAVEYGYLVLCAEGLDNSALVSALGIYNSTEYNFYEKDGLHHFVFDDGYELCGCNELYSENKPLRKKTKADMIPYFEWANRSESDMAVWVLTEQKNER